jgi:hypothetical protein
LPFILSDEDKKIKTFGVPKTLLACCRAGYYVADKNGIIIMVLITL